MSDSFSFENSEDLDIFLRVLAEEVTKSAKVSLTEEKDEEQTQEMKDDENLEGEHGVKSSENDAKENES